MLVLLFPFSRLYLYFTVNKLKCWRLPPQTLVLFASLLIIEMFSIRLSEAKENRRTFQRWKSFASSKVEMQVFPVRTEHVALYLQHLLRTTNSHSAVDSAIYGTRWAHNLAGIPSPTDSPIIYSISRAAKKLIGTRLVNKKEPISREMIRKLVEDSDLDNLVELRNVCIFLLAFAGFFRIEEVLRIKLETLVFIAVMSPLT